MNSRKILVALLVLLPFTAFGEDEEKWDVSAIPGESREVVIDTRSGTWMSVDVSPDGQSIVFDLLGDIYVIPASGGKATAVNSGFAWSMQPRFSPDGSEIAFTSDAGGGDNIWIMNADGSDARQLTKEDFRLLNNPYWSPDGEYIAAKKHFTTTRSAGTGEIWIYHRKGGAGVLDANVLEDIYQSDKVNMVMLNGRLYDSATMNEKVTGDRTTKPFYWQ